MMSLEDMQSEIKYEKEDLATSDSYEDMYGSHIMPYVIQSLQVPSEEQYLEVAIRTLPKGLSIRPTTVPGSQYGVWCDSFIPKGIKFGPYDAAADQLNISQRDAFTSANDVVECSWFRYVNCAPSKDQMNLITIENGQKIYYCTSKQISCDEELLSWNDDSSTEIRTIKKEINLAETMDINNEEKDASMLSSYDEASSLKMSNAETSMCHSSDRGTRDTVWSRDAVQLLIKKYKELDQKLFCRLKDKWKAISIVLQQNGYNLSAEDCDQKWRNLKKTYRLVKYNREHTGKGRLTWEYFDVMKDVLHSDTLNNSVANFISPNKTDNSSTRIQHPKNDIPLVCEKPAISRNVLPESSINSVTVTDVPEKSNECKQPATKLWHKKIYSSPPLWFKKLEEERREEKKQLFEMLDKMHNDMVKVMQRRNNILLKLVDMLESRKTSFQKH